MSWTRSFGRFLGYVTAKLGISAVKGKVGDKAGKVVDITKKAGVVLLAVALMGASCREFGIGFGEGIVAGVADEFTPRPTPSRPPVVIEPTPTWTPNPPTIPDSSPTVTPHPPVPTPTQTPGPAPTATPPVVTPAPGAGMPSTPTRPLWTRGACPRGTSELMIGAQRLCLSDTCRSDHPPQNNCQTRTWVGFGGHGMAPFVDADGNTCSGSLCVTPDGWVRDPQLSWMTDMYCRAVELDGVRFLSWAPVGAEWEPAGACPPAVGVAAPEPTATVPPTATPTPGTGCAAVEALEHFMAPGNHCHAWHPDGGQVACLVDSTIRPICDTDHLENWTTFCGGRTHDPDYNDPAEAMVWMIDGAEDRGPSPANSAQRWIRGTPGAQVSVMVCIRPDARTPDGCRITRRGDGCGVRVFNLPGLQ